MENKEIRPYDIENLFGGPEDASADLNCEISESEKYAIENQLEFARNSGVEIQRADYKEVNLNWKVRSFSSIDQLGEQLVFQFAFEPVVIDSIWRGRAVDVSALLNLHSPDEVRRVLQTEPEKYATLDYYSIRYASDEK